MKINSLRFVKHSDTVVMSTTEKPRRKLKIPSSEQNLKMWHGTIR